MSRFSSVPSNTGVPWEPGRFTGGGPNRGNPGMVQMVSCMAGVVLLSFFLYVCWEKNNKHLENIHENLFVLEVFFVEKVWFVDGWFVEEEQ